MAKGRFSSKQPTSRDPEGGVSAMSILATAAGKDVKSLTKDDITSLATKYGVAKKDVKRIDKGSESMLSSGKSYRVNNDGSYNVFSGTTPDTKASKSAGNKAGFNAGDLVGLGKNASTVVGLAELIRSKGAESTRGNQVGKPTGSEATITSPGEKYMPKVDVSNFTSSMTPSGTRGAGTKTGGSKPGSKKNEDSTVGLMPPLSEFLKNGVQPRSLPGPAVPINAPSVPKKLADETMALVKRKEADKYQKEYSTYLSNKYSNMFSYLTNNDKLDNNRTLMLRSDAEKIQTTQPNLYKYMMEHHGERMGRILNPQSFEKGGKFKLANGGTTDPWSVAKVNQEYLRGLIKSVNLPKNNTSLTAQPMQENPGIFTSRSPTLASGAEGGSGKGMDTEKLGDNLATAAKYALPFIGEALSRREMDKAKGAEYTPADFLAGTVSDLARPNMGLRYREPVGTDVLSQTAGLKFGDAQARDAELNYSYQNAMHKLQQSENILGRVNQGNAMNAQMKNQHAISNAYVGLNKAFGRAESVSAPFVAASQHIAADSAENAAVKADSKTRRAMEIIKRGDSASEEYKWAIQYINS